jgi:hypothetical protein
MRVRLHVLVVVLATTFLATPIAIYAQDANLPHLERRDGTTQLIVDGKPFLVLGGELFKFLQPEVHEAAHSELVKPLSCFFPSAEGDTQCLDCPRTLSSSHHALGLVQIHE